jgi:hypothetical protein
MIGGVVIGTVRWPIEPIHALQPGELGPDMTDEALLHVQGVDSEANETRLVRVNERMANGRVVIQIGDRVWWQCGKLMWNGKDWPEHHPRDVQLKLVSHT